MASLQARVTKILTSPATEWPIIAGETTDTGRLYKEYIAPLSAIGPIATFIGWSILGASMPLVGYYKRPFLSGLTGMVVSYVLGLIGVYLCAMVIEWLAPKFKSSGSRVDALKLVAYASTPGWIAGALNVLPALGVLALLAMLYGVYLFYLGLPVIMKTPADQVVIYMIVSAVVVIVVGMVMASITTLLLGGAALATM